MSDIFDEIAPDRDVAKSDIFDEVAATIDSPAEPASRPIWDTARSIFESPVRIERGIGTGIGDTASGAARAYDIVKEGDILTGPPVAGGNLMQRHRAFTQAMSDPRYLQGGKVDSRFGPEAKLESIRIPEVIRAEDAKEASNERQKRLEENPVFKWGREQRQFSEKTFKGSPDIDDTFVSKLAEGIGSTVPTIAVAAIPVAGPYAASAAYGVQAGEQQAREAVESGKPEVADIAFLNAAGLGATTEKLIGVAPNFFKITRNARMAGADPRAFGNVFTQWLAENPKKAVIIQSYLREGAQEASEQAGQNIIASKIAGYDPDRPLMEDVPEAGLLGSTIGGLTGGAIAGSVALEFGQERKRRLTRLKLDRASQERADRLAARRAELSPELATLAESVENEFNQPKTEPVAPTTNPSEISKPLVIAPVKYEGMQAGPGGMRQLWTATEDAPGLEKGSTYSPEAIVGAGYSMPEIPADWKPPASVAFVPEKPVVSQPQINKPEVSQKLLANMQGREMEVTAEEFSGNSPHLNLVLGKNAPSWENLRDADLITATPTETVMVRVQVKTNPDNSPDTRLSKEDKGGVLEPQPPKQNENRLTKPVSESAAGTGEPEVAEPEVDSVEAKAIEFSNDRKNLTKRLQNFLGFWNIADRKSWKLDAANKRMISPDGKRAVEWITRKDPDAPISYENQQTSEGTARIVPLRETITPPEDTSIGENAAGEKLYQRADGSVYRMRNDRKDRPSGYPDFGGDLAQVQSRAMTFDEFEKQYTEAFRNLSKYKPDEVGSQVFAEKMAALSELNPKWVEAIEGKPDEWGKTAYRAGLDENRRGFHYDNVRNAAYRKEGGKTKLDLILDGVEKSGKEITIEVTDANRENLTRIISTAEQRGLNASTDGKNVLIRPKSPTPTPPTKPTPPSGEQKYQIISKDGKRVVNPQPHTLIERLPATDLEREMGESSVRVRNDKTGEEFITQENQLKIADFSEKADKPAPRNLDAEIRLLSRGKQDPSYYRTRPAKIAAIRRLKKMREVGQQSRTTEGTVSLSTSDGPQDTTAQFIYEKPDLEQDNAVRTLIRVMASQSNLGADERARLANWKRVRAGRSGGHQYGTFGIRGLEEDAWRAIGSVFSQRIIRLDIGNSKTQFAGATTPDVPDTIFLNVRSPQALTSLVGHELLHNLKTESPQLYRQMFVKLAAFMDDAKFNSYLKRKQEQYRKEGLWNIDDSKSAEELFADFFQDSFQDKAFWNRLAEKEPTLFKKLATTVLEFLNKLTAKLKDVGAYRYFDDIDKAHDVIADALAEFARRSPEAAREPLKTNIENEPGRTDRESPQGKSEEKQQRLAEVQSNERIPQRDGGYAPLEASRVGQDLESSGEVLRATSDAIERLFANPIRRTEATGSSPASYAGGAAESGALPAGSETASDGDSEQSRVIIAEVPEMAGQQLGGSRNSNLLAHRILFGLDDASRAALVGEAKATADLVDRLIKKLPGLKYVFDEIAGDKKTHATYSQEWGAVIINTAVLDTYDFSRPESFALWDAAMSEELLHAATHRVATRQERTDVWKSLSRQERRAVLEAYGTDEISQEAAGYEYLRMILQERLTGQTTEKFSGNRLSIATKKALQKIVKFLKEAFGAKPVNDIARQIIERIEGAIKGEKPIKEGIWTGGENISSTKDLRAAVRQFPEQKAESEPEAKRNISRAQAGDVLGRNPALLSRLQNLEAQARIEPKTAMERMIRDKARRIMSNAFVKRAMRVPAQVMNEAAGLVDNTITTFKDIKADSNSTPDEISNAAGEAVKSIEEFERRANEFNRTYDRRREELVKELHKSSKAEMTTMELQDKYSLLVDDLNDLASPLIRQAKDDAAIEALRIVTDKNRQTAIRNVIRFVGDNVEVAAMSKAGIGNTEQIFNEIKRKGGADYVQKVGASDEIIRAISRVLAFSAPLRERLQEAKNLTWLKGQNPPFNKYKNRIVAAILKGDYDRAMTLFSRTTQAAAASERKYAEAAAYYARRTHSNLVALQALDGIQKLADDVRKSEEYKDERKAVFDYLNVRDVLVDEYGKTIVLKPLTPEGKELRLIFGNDSRSEEAQLDAIRKYYNDGMELLADEKLSPEKANAFRAVQPLLESQLDPSRRPAAARLMPNWTKAPIKWIFKKIERADQIPRYIVEGGGGPALAAVEGTENAYRTVGEQNQRVYNQHVPKLRNTLAAALKSHSGMSPDTYRTKVWNLLVGSRQNFNDTGRLGVGSPIGNGESVTAEDMAYLAADRAFFKDQSDMVNGVGKVQFDKFGKMFSGILYDSEGRVRLPYATGIDTMSRRLSKEKQIAPWVSEWLSLATPEGRVAFLDRQFDRFVIGYADAVRRADWTQKHIYKYRPEIQGILKEAGDNPITSFSDLTDKIAKKRNEQLEDGQEPVDSEDVRADLLSEFDRIFRRMEIYGREEKTSRKQTFESFGGDNAFNTERGNLIAPPGWYDYGGVTDEDWSGSGTNALLPFQRAYYTALKALDGSLTDIAKKFSEKASEPEMSSRKVRKDSLAARRRGELIYSWADAVSLQNEVAEFLKKLDRLIQSPRQVLQTDRPQQVMTSGVLQGFVASILSRPISQLRNFFGGLTQAAIADQVIRGHWMEVSAARQAGRVLNTVYDEILTRFAHDGNPIGKKIYQILNNAQSRAIVGGMAHHLVDRINSRRELYADAKDRGLSLQHPLKEAVGSLFKYWKTGGIVEGQEPDSAIAKAKGAFTTATRAAAKVMSQSTVGYVDSVLNIIGMEQARDYEQYFKKLADKYGPIIEQLAESEGRNPNDWQDPMNLLPDKAFEGGLGFGGEQRSLTTRQFFRRNAGINLDKAILDYRKKVKEAEARGEEAGDIPLFTDEQRNELQMASAEDINLATNSSRPIWSKLSAMHSKLGLLLGYRAWTLQKYTRMFNQSSQAGFGAGLMNNLPLLTRIAIVMALMFTLPQELYERLKNLLYGEYSGFPTISQARSPEAAIKSVGLAVANEIPLYGTAAASAFQLGYGSKLSIDDNLLLLKATKDAFTTGKEIYQSRDPVMPLARLANRYMAPFDLMGKNLPAFTGTIDQNNSKNILRSSIRAEGDEHLLKPQGGFSDIQYTPATPHVNRAVNAIGNGDMTEFQKQFKLIVEAKRELGSRNPEMDARKAIAARNPVQQVFKTLPTSTQLNGYINGLPEYQQQLVREQLKNFERATSLIGVNSATTQEGKRGGSSGGSSSGGGGGGYAPSSRSFAMPRSRGRSTGIRRASYAPKIRRLHRTTRKPRRITSLRRLTRAPRVRRPSYQRLRRATFV